jgi:hypothetical protein
LANIHLAFFNWFCHFLNTNRATPGGNRLHAFGGRIGNTLSFAPSGHEC